LAGLFGVLGAAWLNTSAFVTTPLVSWARAWLNLSRDIGSRAEGESRTGMVTGRMIAGNGHQAQNDQTGWEGGQQDGARDERAEFLNYLSPEKLP
jgi:hypothetical protein